MAETTAELELSISEAIAPGFRSRLRERGLARGLVWSDGRVPPDAPAFSETLTDDLLDYAYGLFALALRLRLRGQRADLVRKALLVVGESIEAAVHRGKEDAARGFHRVSAAVAFHLARYSARAYSVLPTETSNLAPTERALVFLLRRQLDQMRATVGAWLFDDANEDDSIATRLAEDEEFDAEDAADLVLTSAFMRGLAIFDHSLTGGDPESAAAAREALQQTAAAAGDLSAPNHWWTATLASHLVDELWQLSLHQRIPILPDGDTDAERWNNLRQRYIHRLRLRSRAAIELWPSQLSAVKRAVDLDDDLVVALPTSAGKTRIAELCILRALAAGQRTVYVTPLRALSAQVERDLSETFLPLGFAVSSLYGSAGLQGGDSDTLREERIVVATPEKLDFAIRNDPSIIDDVGLIILDEGHMLGPNEREVRYEALVQRLLRRSDSDARRLVCLSALFPKAEALNDIVAWMRQDSPGDPVRSDWRPTRQRFGVVRWRSDVARLDVEVGDVPAFIPRLIEARKPPPGSRRRKLFPADKNELTLATAWRFVEQKKDVLLFSPVRGSVETLGKLALKLISEGVLPRLKQTNADHRQAMAVGAEWLGPDHPAVAALQYGVALHHGHLPRPFLNEVERILRAGACPLTIASPTLAQGLNLSASVLLVPSIWRNKKIIPDNEFANVAGRAGRAFVDLEGLVLHVVWDKSTWNVGNWNALVERAKTPLIRSGILHLTLNLCEQIARASGVELNEVVDYVTGNDAAWQYNPTLKATHEISEDRWARDVASLDAAILSLLDADTADGALRSTIESVLAGSLVARELERGGAAVTDRALGFLAARAARIWSNTSVAQRRGYHAAGIGFEGGQFIDDELAQLVTLLAAAEDGLANARPRECISALVTFARLVFQTAPFTPPEELPAAWPKALEAWMDGRPSAEVVAICGEDGVDLLQEAFSYRLPWAIEAVRVHALAVDAAGADTLTGLAALAVEAGSTDPSVIQLVRSGLDSREAATAAVRATGADFVDRDGMVQWLRSPEVERMSAASDWPTAASRASWLMFVASDAPRERTRWSSTSQTIRVTWAATPPPAGEHLVISSAIDDIHFVMTPSFEVIGWCDEPPKRGVDQVVDVLVTDGQDAVTVSYFGPKPPRPK